MAEETRTNNCEQCGAATSFERRDASQPPEGQVCSICDDWVCDDCTDYVNSDGDVCKKCSAQGLKR